MRVVVVENVVCVGAKLGREVLGAHRTVNGVAVAVEPGPVSGKWLALFSYLGVDLRSRQRRSRGRRWRSLAYGLQAAAFTRLG